MQIYRKSITNRNDAVCFIVVLYIHKDCGAEASNYALNVRKLYCYGVGSSRKQFIDMF